MTVVNKLTRNRKVEVAVDADRKLISAGCAGLQHPALLRCDEALRPPCGDSSAGDRNDGRSPITKKYYGTTKRFVEPRPMKSGTYLLLKGVLRKSC